MSDKKIVLITGATRGIGLAIAKEMAKNNYIVLGTGASKSSATLLENVFEKHNIDGKPSSILLILFANYVPFPIFFVPLVFFW